jgi:hypothetical protein
VNNVATVGYRTGRYRIHRKTSGQSVFFEAEWQRDFSLITSQSFITEDGETITYKSTPPWESTLERFTTVEEATGFAKAALDGKAVVPATVQGQPIG